MTANISSAFWLRMQNPDVSGLKEVIDIIGNGFSAHYTTANQEFTAPLSGTNRTYLPMPGGISGAPEQSTDFSVSVMEMVLSSSEQNFGDLARVYAFDRATVSIDMLFVDTPGLGRLPIFQGNVGDVSFTRIAGQFEVRNIYGSRATDIAPHEYANECVWRFGGPGCLFDLSSVTIAVSPANINQNSSTNQIVNLNSLSTLHVNSFFERGRVVFKSGPNSGQQRTIRDQSGLFITLSHPVPFSVSTTDAFDMTAGCRKRLVEDCSSKFNNTFSYLGFAFAPTPGQKIEGNNTAIQPKTLSDIKRAGNQLPPQGKYG